MDDFVPKRPGVNNKLFHVPDVRVQRKEPILHIGPRQQPATAVEDKPDPVFDANMVSNIIRAYLIQ